MEKFGYLTRDYIEFCDRRITFLWRVSIDQIRFCIIQECKGGVKSNQFLKGPSVVTSINALCVHPLSSAYLGLGLWGLKTKLGLPDSPITSNSFKLQ